MRKRIHAIGFMQRSIWSTESRSIYRSIKVFGCTKLSRPEVENYVRNFMLHKSFPCQLCTCSWELKLRHLVEKRFASKCRSNFNRPRRMSSLQRLSTSDRKLILGYIITSKKCWKPIGIWQCHVAKHLIIVRYIGSASHQISNLHLGAVVDFSMVTAPNTWSHCEIH